MRYPLAREGGAVDVFASLDTEAYRLLRFDGDGELHTVRRVTTSMGTLSRSEAIQTFVNPTRHEDTWLARAPGDTLVRLRLAP